jgi:hypothetical protein
MATLTPNNVVELVSNIDEPSSMGHMRIDEKKKSVVVDEEDVFDEDIQFKSLEPISNDIRKKIVAKIHRYIHLNKFIDNEIEYIQRIFEMDISKNKKQISENEAGMLLIANEYSDETFRNVMIFLSQCEQNWAQKVKEDKSFLQTKMKTGTSSSGNTKKPKTMDNPLIHNDHGGGAGSDDDPDDPDDPEDPDNVDNDEDNTLQKNEKKRNNKLASQLKIMDNKKHPLAYYKGSLNRIMRTARNISMLQGIPEHTKKYTSEILGFGDNVPSNNPKKTETKKPIVSKKRPLKAVDPHIWIEEVSSNEESDKNSDNVEDDLALLSRKYNKVGEGDEAEDEDEGGGEDNEEDFEQIIGDYDNEIENDDDEEIDECIVNDDEVDDDEEEDDEDDDEVFSDDDE